MKVDRTQDKLRGPVTPSTWFGPLSLLSGNKAAAAKYNTRAFSRRKSFHPKLTALNPRTELGGQREVIKIYFLDACLSLNVIYRSHQNVSTSVLKPCMTTRDRFCTFSVEIGSGREGHGYEPPNLPARHKHSRKGVIPQSARELDTN